MGQGREKGVLIKKAFVENCDYGFLNGEEQKHVNSSKLLFFTKLMTS